MDTAIIIDERIGTKEAIEGLKFGILKVIQWAHMMLRFILRLFEKDDKDKSEQSNSNPVKTDKDEYENNSDSEDTDNEDNELELDSSSRKDTKKYCNDYSYHFTIEKTCYICINSANYQYSMCCRRRRSKCRKKNYCDICKSKQYNERKNYRQ